MTEYSSNLILLNEGINFFSKRCESSRVDAGPATARKPAQEACGGVATVASSARASQTSAKISLRRDAACAQGLGTAQGCSSTVPTHPTHATHATHANDDDEGRGRKVGWRRRQAGGCITSREERAAKDHAADAKDSGRCSKGGGKSGAGAACRARSRRRLAPRQASR